MAKSDTPLEKIDLSRVFGGTRKPNWGIDKQINGYDTECIDGDIFILSYDFGNGGKCVSNYNETLSQEKIWQMLTHKKARSSLNMWYNLNFDANVIFKKLLTQEELSILSVSNSVETQGYEIDYVPGKFLRISDEHRHNYTHFDASQFFYTSLENAAKNWSENEKLVEQVETKLFGSSDSKELSKTVKESNVVSWKDLHLSKGNNWKREDARKYINKNWESILAYAKVDAELVKEIWENFVNLAENKLDIPCGLPFSTGYLAESYLDNKFTWKPGLGPQDMPKLAWKTYNGGRFEAIKRGNVGKVIGPDINSAYPYILSKLPEADNLDWKLRYDVSIEDIKQADYGFIEATVTTDKTRKIQPFAVKMKNGKKDENGSLKYPALFKEKIHCIKDIFENAWEYDYLEDFEIHEAWLGFEHKGTDKPFSFIQDLYKERKQYERNEKYKLAQALKIILNSMYGKMCQTTPKREKLKEPKQLTEDEWHVPSLSLPENLRGAFDSGFVERLEAGSWFNPFLATYITGLTRLELHKRVLEYGLEENTPMLATDCLMIEKEAFDNTTFEKDLVKEGLGNWDIEYAGNAFIVGAGVYQINFDTCNNHKCQHYNTENCPTESHYQKIKTRGFNERDISGSLQNMAQKSNENLKIESLRPKTFGEAVWQNQKISEIGQFLKFEKELSPNMDTNRNWPYKTTFKHLLQNCETSKPLVCSS